MEMRTKTMTNIQSRPQQASHPHRHPLLDRRAETAAAAAARHARTRDLDLFRLRLTPQPSSHHSICTRRRRLAHHTRAQLFIWNHA